MKSLVSKTIILRAVIILSLCFCSLLAIVNITDADSSNGFFRVDKTKSQFRIFVYKSGIASGLAHNHVIGVDDFRGSVLYKRDKLESSTVMIIVQSKSLQVLDKKLSDEDKKAVKKNMDAEVLHVKKHKLITFKSKKTELITRTAATKTSPELLKLNVTGSLSLHGKSRDITLPVEFKIENGTVTATGSTELKQSLWGIEPYSAFLGTVGVKDIIKVEFTIKSGQS